MRHPLHHHFTRHTALVLVYWYLTSLNVTLDDRRQSFVPAQHGAIHHLQSATIWTLDYARRLQRTAHHLGYEPSSANAVFTFHMPVLRHVTNCPDTFVRKFRKLLKSHFSLALKMSFVLTFSPSCFIPLVHIHVLICNRCTTNSR